MPRIEYARRSRTLLGLNFLPALRLALQPCRTPCPLFRRHILRIFELVCDFFAASNLPSQLALKTRPAPHFHRNRVARPQARCLLPGFLPSCFAVDFENRVALLQTRALSPAARGNCSHDHRAIKVSRGHKSRIADRALLLDQSKSHASEEVIPRNLLRTRYIFCEKPSQVRMAHRLGRLTHAF